MLRIFLAMFLSALSTTALAAGSVSNTTITSIEVDSGGNLGVWFANSVSGGPSCATYTSAMVIPASNQNAISTAQLAFALGSTVTAAGTGTCPVWSTYEGLATLNL